MAERDELDGTSATLTDDDIVTRRAPALAETPDDADTGDTGDDSGDVSDSGDTGDTSDTGDTGDDSAA